MKVLYQTAYYLKFLTLGCLILCLFYNITTSIYYKNQMALFEITVIIILIGSLIKKNRTSLFFLIAYILLFLLTFYWLNLNSRFIDSIYFSLRFNILLDLIIDREIINEYVILNHLFWFFKGIYFYVFLYIIFLELPLRIKKKNIKTL